MQGLLWTARASDQIRKTNVSCFEQTGYTSSITLKEVGTGRLAAQHPLV